MKWVADPRGGISCEHVGFTLHVKPLGELFSGWVYRDGSSYRVAPQKTIDAACKAASMKAESLRDSEGGAS